MTTLVTRGYELINNYADKMHVISLISDDTGFMYVFGSNKDNVPFDSKTRVASLMSRITTPVKQLKASDYSSIGQIGLDAYVFDEPFTSDSRALAVRDEELDIDRAFYTHASVQSSVAGLLQSQRIDQVLEDFPDLFDQLANTDPKQKISADGMVELVFAALGSVDPTGPNAWLLNYIDNPAGESEDAGGDIVFDGDDGDSSTAKTGDK